MYFYCLWEANSLISVQALNNIIEHYVHQKNVAVYTGQLLSCILANSVSLGSKTN